MESKIIRLNFLVHVFIILLLKGLHVQCLVSDPCPSDIPSTTVAEMCTESSAVEEEPSSDDNSNSVVLRMRTRKNCSCHVFFENQSTMRQIRVRRYNDLTASVPKKSPCGLAIDISVFNQTYQQPIPPFNCVEGSWLRYFNLLKNAGLQFTSRVTEGLFERGYCIQFIREPISDSVRLRLKCNGFLTSDLIDTSSILATDATTTQATSDSRNILDSTENQSTLYAVFGVPTAVVLLLLVIIGITLYRKAHVCRRKSDNTQLYQTTCVNNTGDENNAYDTLRNNNQDGPIVTNVQQNTSEEYYNNVNLYTMQQVNSGINPTDTNVTMKLPCKGEEKPQGCQQNLANIIITDDP